MITIRHNHKNRRAFISVDQATYRNQIGLRRALYEIGVENVRHTRQLIFSKDKNGRLYRFRGNLHRASAPGEAPANRTGALAASIGFTVRGHYQMEFGDGVAYGKFLEGGTRNMEARPHLQKTVRAKAKDARLSLLRHTKAEVIK